MAKSGLRDRMFRTCDKGDNLRAPRTPAGYPARSHATLLSGYTMNTARRALAATMLGFGILLTGVFSGPPRAHAAETQWWALGTFIQPLGETSANPLRDMRANAPAWEFYENGAKAARAGDDKGAVVQFTRAIALYGPQNPLSAKAYATRAQSLRGLGRNLDAVRTLNALIALNPARPEGYWARARIHMDARDFTKALSDYETVARLSPNLVGAHMGRGEALYELRRSDQAMAAFEDTIKATAKRYETIAEYWKSSIYAESTPGFVETMLTLLRADRDETLARAHVWLGKTHFRRSRFWEASRAFEKAVAIAPGYVPAYKYRGWLNEKMGQIPEARADYKQAASLKKGDPWVIKALKRVR